METVLSILKTIGIILIVVFSFNVIIFVHELGHFLAARWRGLVVERFQIWFGKPIWKKTINGVQYGLGWIPAGGFVALPQMAPMEAIEGDNSDRQNPLPPISPMDKIIVAFAGPLFSFLLALAAALVVWQAGKPKNAIDTQVVGYVAKDMPAEVAGIQRGDEITHINGEAVEGFAGNLDGITERIIFSKGDKLVLTVNRPGVGAMDIETNFHIEDADSFLKRDGHRQIGVIPANEVIVDSLFEGGPAEFSGFEIGDKIIKVNGVTVYSTAQFSEELRANEGKLVEVVVSRAGSEVTLNTRPVVPSNNYRLIPGADPVAMIGMGFKDTRESRLVYPDPWTQVKDTSRMLWVTIDALSSSDSSVGVKDLSGPVGIGKVKYNILLHADYPWQQMMYFWVLFNINLAIFNLLPFPVLDGGHITMAVMEAIRKKPLNQRFLEYVQMSFVVLLLSMFVYVTMKDSFTSLGGDAPAKRSEDEPKSPSWTAEDLEKALK